MKLQSGRELCHPNTANNQYEALQYKSLFLCIEVTLFNGLRSEVILALDFVLCACLHVLFSILDIVSVGMNKCVLVLEFLCLKLWTWFNQFNGLNGEKKELIYIFQKYCYYSSAGQWLAFLKTRVDGRNQVVECRQHYLQCTGCTSSNCHQGCLWDHQT